MTPAAVATGFIEAFGKGDMEGVAGFIADDITFQSPRTRIEGAENVLVAIEEFAGIVDSVDIVAVLSDEKRAMILYEMRTGQFGNLRAVDYLLVENGKIVSDVLIFDTCEVSQAS